MAEETISILRLETGEAVRSVRDLRQRISELKQEMNDLEVGSAQYLVTQKELAVAQTVLSNSTRGTAVSMEEATAAANGVGQSYNALTARMAALRREQRSVDVSTEAGKKQFAELATQINGVNDQLKAMDAMNGNYQRNVGNYASALNGLNVATSQIVRELPALGMNLNTFFLAISNNIPMLVDQINLLRAQNAQLMAEGKQGINILKAVASSFLSWNTVLTVVITLFTMFGDKIGDFITSLFKGKQATDDLTESLGSLDDVMGKIRMSEAEATAEASAYYAIATDVNRAMEDRLAAAHKLQEMYPAYLGNLSEEYIVTGQAADAYNMLTASLTQQARAKAAMSAVTEEYSKQLEIQMKLEEAMNQLPEARRSAESAGQMLATASASQMQFAARNAAQAGKQVRDLEDAIEAYNRQLQESQERIAAILSAVSAEGITPADPGAALEPLKDKTVKVDIGIEVDPDIIFNEETAQEELEAYLEQLRESLQQQADEQLSQLDTTTEYRKRRAKLDAETEREAQDEVLRIEQESYRQRIALLQQFSQQALAAGDMSAYLDYQQQALDTELQMQLRTEEQKKESYQRDVKNREKAAKQTISSVSSILDSLGDIYEENSEGNEEAARQAKNLRIASTIIDTISGATSAYMSTWKAYGEIPGIGPALAAALAGVNAAAVLAAGYAQVQQIRNTDVDKDSAPSSSSSSSISATVSAPQVPSELPQTRTITSASEEERLNRMAEDQRVYVVYSDISQAGRKVQVRESESTF